MKLIDHFTKTQLDPGYVRTQRDEKGTEGGRETSRRRIYSLEERKPRLKPSGCAAPFGLNYTSPKEKVIFEF